MIAIRGAVRAERNRRDAIFRSTQRMLREIRDRNGLAEDDVLSALYTMTPDLDADFPAYAARALGWEDTAMLGARETAVPGAMDRVIRVLVHARTDGPARHVYLGEAAAMRPDLAEDGDAGATWAGARQEGTPAAGARFGALLVVGVGLVGGSAALALRHSGLFREVWGHDRNPGAMERALRAGALDRAVDRAELSGREGPAGRDDALARADAVLMALPVDALVDWLDRHGRRLGRGTVVLDVGSTKRRVVRALEGLPEGVQSVGAHPMTGSTESGMGAARPDLFHGAPWALVETAATGDRARSVAEALVEAVGGHAFWTDAGAHDRATAATSHVPYLLSAALARHLEERSDGLPIRRLLGPGARDMTRLSVSDPDVMSGILATNWSNVLEEVEAFRRELDELVAELASGRSRPGAAPESDRAGGGPAIGGAEGGEEGEAPDAEAIRARLERVRRTGRTVRAGDGPLLSSYP